MYREVLTFFFIISCFLSLYDVKRLSKAAVTVIYIVLVALVVFRPENMPDYQGYVQMYENGSDRLEVNYQIMFAVLHSFKAPSFYFFVLMAILTVGIKLLAIDKMSKWPYMAICIWMSDVMIMQDMVTIRAALASSFLFGILYFKTEKKNLWMWLSVVLAVCSHLSALVFVVVPFLSGNKPRRTVYVTLLCLALFIPMANVSLLDIIPVGITAYSHLVDTYINDTTVNPYNLVVLARMLICLSLWWRYKTAQADDRFFLISLKAYSIGCILFFLFWKQMSVALRLGELFWPTEILIMPYLMNFLGRRNLELGRLIPLLAAVVLFLINITVDWYWNPSAVAN